MMMARFFITIMLLLAGGSSAFAQDAPPPPPPPPEVDVKEVDVKEGDVNEGDGVNDSEPDPKSESGVIPEPSGEPDANDTNNSTKSANGDEVGLAIVAPIAGAAIGTSTVVEGTAPIGKLIELRVDGQVEQRMRVDATGRFRIAVSGLPENSRVRLEVIQFDGSGEEVTSTSVVARTGLTETIDAPEDPPPAPVEEAPAPEAAPLGRPTPVDPGPPIKAPVSQPMRGFLSALAGTASGFIGATAGGFIGVMVALAASDGDGDLSELGYIFFGITGGYLIGVPLGVVLTGYLLDGNGSILLSVLATYAGLVLGGLVLFPVLENGGENAALLLFGLTTFVGAGSGALVYELTSDPSRRAADELKGVTVSPGVAPTADGRGVVFGLGGTF
jgi:hypothetical protein